jgi:hypothetical protein
MRTLFNICTVVALAGVLTPPSAQAQDRVFFGNLHSHTSYSDGSSTPAEAFRHARDVAGLDFLAVTEHNHAAAESGADPDRLDGILIATQPQLYNGSPQSLVAAANAANRDGEFVAIFGQEFSTISSGNHVNVFGVEEVITVRSGFFRAFSRWLAEHPVGDQPALLQFNHPWDFDDSSREYGADDFGSHAEWVRRMDRLAELIEVVNGPAMTKNPGQLPANVVEQGYLEYLNLGFHLGPTGNQDNHYLTWGDATEARTGVIAPQLTRPAIMAALRQRHVYASEDRNLQVIARVNGRLMGDIISTLPTIGSELDLRVTVHDPDEPNARYTVQVFSDRRAGGATADVVRTFSFQGDVQDRALTGVRYRGNGHYLFLKIRQTSPSGANANRVWTAPVWFEAS